MGVVVDDSDESFVESRKEDNKQLQQKVDKNEKLIQQLELEQSEHENALKASFPSARVPYE